MNIDLYLFDYINGFTGKNKWLDMAGVFFASYVGYLVVIALLAFAVFERNMAIFFMPVFAGMISRFVINETVYFFYKRKRPCQDSKGKTLIKIPRHPSFPSGHTSFFFALSFALFEYSAILAITFLVLSFLISFSRIFSGVHWPSDILAGMVAGAGSALLVFARNFF